MIIEIPNAPIGQARPKFARMGKFTRVYNPQQKLDDSTKAYIKTIYKDDPIESPVSLRITFLMPIPASFSKKKKIALEGQVHVKKFDLDNLLKKALDYMNGIVFKDDAQVYRIEAEKRYSSSPKTIIEIRKENHNRSCFQLERLSNDLMLI